MNYAKWQEGYIHLPSKFSIDREERIYNLVANYPNRDILIYIRGIAHIFSL